MDDAQIEAAFSEALSHQRRTQLEAKGVVGWQIDAILSAETKAPQPQPPPPPPPVPAATAQKAAAAPLARPRQTTKPPVPLFSATAAAVDERPMCTASDVILLHLFRAWALQWKPASAEREAVDPSREIHSDAADPDGLCSYGHRCDSRCPRFETGDYSICQICGDLHICGRDCVMLTPTDELGSSFSCSLTCRSFACELKFEMYDRDGTQTHASREPTSRAKGTRKRKASDALGQDEQQQQLQQAKTKKKRKFESKSAKSETPATDEELERAAYMASPQTSREARDVALAQHTAEATTVVHRIIQHADGKDGVVRLAPLAESTTNLIVSLWVLVQQTERYKANMGSYRFTYHCYVVLYEMICGFSRMDGTRIVPICDWMHDKLPNERQLEQLFGVRPSWKTDSDKFFRACIRSVTAEHAKKLLAKSIASLEAVCTRMDPRGAQQTGTSV